MTGAEGEKEKEREEPDWYRRWFGEEYLELYPHRDRREADAAASLLRELTGVRPGERVLDLACGAGRHLAALRDRGLDAVGLDLSPVLLGRAADLAPGTPLIRGDMRALPFRDGGFRVVGSFFTSFGYFESEEEDRRVLAEVRRVLVAGGHLLLDFLNADEVRRSLTARDEAEVEGRRVVQERALVDGGRIVEKRIRIEGGAGEGVRRYRERVRLYEPEELREALEREGLMVRRRMGDYDGSSFASGSPRLILFAEAVGAAGE